MRVTVYLPDDLRQRAAEAELNLSALLRAAVEAELAGEPGEARRLTDASVSVRPARRGVELVVFVPGGARLPFRDVERP